MAIFLLTYCKVMCTLKLLIVHKVATATTISRDFLAQTKDQSYTAKKGQQKMWPTLQKENLLCTKTWHALQKNLTYSVEKKELLYRKKDL